MKINRLVDGSYTIDQSLFVQSILRRFCPADAPYGLPVYKDTPAPIKYQARVSNRPTENEKQIIRKRYGKLSLSQQFALYYT